MPYRVLYSQSRVDIIKKKFENPFGEENHPEPLRCNSATIPYRTRFLEELKDFNLNKKVQQWEEGSDGKGEGKAHVKRSPAFRRDKTGCVRNFNQSQTSPKSENQNAQEILSEEIKRSKTDTNLLKYSSRKADCKTDTQSDVIQPQYSIVNKNRKETVNLKFSESIRRALQSPLPTGPPPKKPPRTFCHKTAQSPSDASPQSDIPLLKSKLEKLEKVVMIHESGSHASKQKDCKMNKLPGKKESSSMPDVYGSKSFCLPICLSQCSKELPKSKSEFYFGLNKSESEADRAKEFGKPSDFVAGSCKEVIYDLPFVNKKNKFETFGKSSRDENEKNKEEGLHYMCTDVVNQSPPNLSSFHWRKSFDGNTGGTDSKLTEVEKQMSSSMSRIDDVKELVNELRIGNGNRPKGVNDLSGSATFEESSGESELDSFAVVSECEARKEAEMTAKRKIYVSRVSSMLLGQAPGFKSKNNNSYSHLFECCLLVGLTLCESMQNVPYIKSIFPPNTKPPPLIEFLCFPDASYWPPSDESSHPEEQCYSLVVTNENGERKFGYCRRVLPEGGYFCLPLTYCIISPHRAGGFFYKVLEELESRHGSPELEKFIKQLYESAFPGPGERLKLKEILEEATRTMPLESGQYLSSTLVRRPADIRMEKDLTLLFKHLQLPVFIKVFSSLLHERKVLLLSNSLRKLSSCIEALESILLPFSWQHTFIPVLPVHLIELCEAPTPFIIGLLKPRNEEKSMPNINFEDGIFVDLDKSKIVRCCGDEGSILPSRFMRDLKTSLGLAMNSSALSESVRSVLISDTFIKFFVQVCGKFAKFIVELPSGEKVFQKEEFVKSSSSNASQSFLDWFSETAMFKTFIHERLQGDEEDPMVKLFSRRAMEYSKDAFKDPAVLLKKKVINRKVRTLGDRIKDLTSFTK